MSASAAPPRESKKQWIAHLREGDVVASYFVLDEKRTRPFKGGQYGDLMLADASGRIKGRLWEQAEALLQDLRQGDVVTVEGRVEDYQGTLQIIVKSLHKMEKGYALRDLVHVTQKDVVHLYQELLHTIESFQDPSLRALLERVFHAEETKRAFMRHPAAKSLHHAYLGGLLEHVMNVVALAEGLCRNYPRLNRDLLLAGVLLHDIGKLWELEAGTRIGYTQAGRLLGHVALGYQQVMTIVSEIPAFPEETRLQLGHLILSHHGELQFGAPIVPAIPEAIALHHLENLDAQIQRFYDLQHEHPSEPWFYDRTKERWLYLDVDRRDVEEQEDDRET